ncbi:hypothetical protein [Actinoalloteichus spitiensis]|uniref:hypothetical protein n=1 Tax=Actinoalloteichus spitiensis TaxID=252394 RepID=UPI000379C853|nr:hypothetical protein [Actinoalloteichus spitiensis]
MERHDRDGLNPQPPLAPDTPTPPELDVRLPELDLDDEDLAAVDPELDTADSVDSADQEPPD